MTGGTPRGRQQAPTQSGGRRLPIDVAPALSVAGLVVIAVVSVGLLGGNLPSLPGNGGDDGNGPIRTATPSDVVIIDPRADIPGSMLYMKEGNIWIQTGDEARQLTDSGRDSMPAWSPDGASIFFVRTTEERGTWPSAGELREYNLVIPRLVEMNADGTGEPVGLMVGRTRSGSNTWSYFIREPSISPDGETVAVITDGPDASLGDPLVKLLDIETQVLTDPELAESQFLGHASPAWSPDGRFLLYVRNAREGPRGTPVIMRYNLETEGTRPMTTAGYANPAWSRDGRYVAATKTNNFGTNVVILDARTGTEVLRVTDDDESFSPVWSPRMDAIAFFRVRHGVVDLWLVPLGGTAPAWEAGEPIAMTIAAGLDGSARPAWFIPADQLPPLPTPTPDAPPATAEPGATVAP